MHLVLGNIAKAKHPKPSPCPALQAIWIAVNKATGRSSGFVWRLVDNVTKALWLIKAGTTPTI